MIGKAGIRFIALAFAATLAISCVCAPDEMENVVEDVRVSPLPPGSSPPVSAVPVPLATTTTTIAQAPASSVQPLRPVAAVPTAIAAGSPMESKPEPALPVTTTTLPAPVYVAPPVPAATTTTTTTSTTTTTTSTTTTTTSTTTTTTLPPPAAAPAPALAAVGGTEVPDGPPAPRPSYPDPTLPDLSPPPPGESAPSLDGTFYVLSPTGIESTTTVLPAQTLVPGNAANVSGNAFSALAPSLAPSPQTQIRDPEPPRAVPVPQPQAPETATRPEPVSIEMNLSPMPFSPDSDGVNDRVVFTPKVSEPGWISQWRLSVYWSQDTWVRAGKEQGMPTQDALFKEWKGIGDPPYSITWDGKDTSGRLVDSGTEYSWAFVVKDSSGREVGLSGLLPVDILVTREAGRLRIMVPSILFRSDRADFTGLGPEELDANARTIARIASILAKFPSFSILVEGHGNNVGKMSGFSATRIAAEEKKEVLPLSAARAEFVRTLLSLNGIDSRRMTARGMGSSMPLYDPRNLAMRSRNRRVEFILSGR